MRVSQVSEGQKPGGAPAVDASREARPGFPDTNLTEAPNRALLETIAPAWLRR